MKLPPAPRYYVTNKRGYVLDGPFKTRTEAERERRLYPYVHYSESEVREVSRRTERS